MIYNQSTTVIPSKPTVEDPLRIHRSSETTKDMDMSGHQPVSNAWYALRVWFRRNIISHSKLFLQPFPAPEFFEFIFALPAITINFFIYYFKLHKNEIMVFKED